MTTPALRALRQRYSRAHISIVVPKSRKGFYQFDPCVNEIIPYPRKSLDYLLFVLSMRKRKYDLGIVFAGDGHTPLLLAVCGIPRRIGHIGYPRSDLFTKQVPYPTGMLCGYKRCTDLAEAAGAPANDFRPHFVFKREPLLPLSPWKLHIGVHPGGREVWNRRWPLERYCYVCTKICRELSASVYLFGSADERANNEVIRKHVKGHYPNAQIYNLAGVSLNTTANYIAACDLYLGNDSGPMHLAVAVGTPVVALFGPSDRWAVGPDLISPRHFVIYKDLSCQPCPHGRCFLKILHPNQDRKCLTDITGEEVFRTIKARLSSVSHEKPIFPPID